MASRTGQLARPEDCCSLRWCPGATHQTSGELNIGEGAGPVAVTGANRPARKWRTGSSTQACGRGSDGVHITDKIDPIDLLTDFMGRRACSVAETSQFQTLKHNKDLCPRFTENAKRVFFDYERHRSEIHDIQGFGDRGNDIVVGFKSDDGTRRIGLQIKSYDDFRTWWGNKTQTSFMDKLRSQFAQATNGAGVDLWYLVLCTDEEVHRDALRHVRSEFADYEKVRIVDPVEALTFFRMSELDIDIEVSRRLSGQDYVRLQAKELLDGYPREVRELVIELSCLALTGSPNLPEDDVYPLLADIADGPDDDPADVLGMLEGFLDADYETGGYRISIDRVEPLAALYYEQRVRYGAARSQMAERLGKLLA